MTAGTRAEIGSQHRSGEVLALGVNWSPIGFRRQNLGFPRFEVSTVRARALKASDPAVQVGKYAVIAVPWMVPAGAMSFSPARFPRSASEALGS